MIDIMTDSNHNKKKSKKRKSHETIETHDMVNMEVEDQYRSNSEHGATETSPSSPRKRKSKGKLFTSEADAASTEENSAVVTKAKKRKKDKTQNELHLQSESTFAVDDKPGSDDLGVEVDLGTSPRKKKSRKVKSLSSTDVSDPVLPSVKKPKREKAKSTDESSLGVINKDILQQAEINLGLPMVDKLEKDSEMQSPDAASNTSLGEETVKKKKKKKKDKSQTEEQSNTPNEKSRNDRAIEYLRLWGSNRKAWKFNKMLQVQLLHIMYDKSLVSDEDFETLLLYMDGMKGKGRDKTKESAKKILDEGETETADAEKEERARQIFQMLS